MRIERVVTYPLLYRLGEPYGDANGLKKFRTAYMIRVITDEGLEGWGECSGWLPSLDQCFKESIIPYLTGRSVYERAKHSNKIAGWERRAAACVDMALTEIAAKQAGLHITDLWGGLLRESVPVYASFQSYSSHEDWMQRSWKTVEKAMEQGFYAAKVKVGGKTIREDQRHISRLLDMMKELNQDASTSVQHAGLALDANQSYDAAAAREWTRQLRAWDDVLWFEEPMPIREPEEYRYLRSVLPVPVAGGENIQDVHRFLPMLYSHALDLAQPDPMHLGGLEPYRDVLRAARHLGVRVSPHTFDGALARLYALFAQACLEPWSKMAGSGIEPVEWDVTDNPLNGLVGLQPVNGQVRIPGGPGIGVEMDTDLLAKYRWDGSSYGVE
ncbi:mandelate racemase/muconate lactonizing enzyme family protein [Paenibacillus gansuensis]|uniref:Mandelate racemase/muconate lactonizing enzyme family protein n=1 Tax=Paenibacillus gansuensis TaxID=306542 RepID=A0ABW5PD93_9BACL